MSENTAPKILISTTQRCGSTWLASICCAIVGRSFAEYVGGLPFGLMNFEDFGTNDDEKVRKFSAKVSNVGQQTGTRVFKTHDLPPKLVPIFLEQNPDFFVANIIRDFRDIMVSRLMYNRYYLPTQGLKIESKFVQENPALSDSELVDRFYGNTEMTEWLLQWKLFSPDAGHPRSMRFSYESMLDEKNLAPVVSELGRCLSPPGIAEARVKEITASVIFEKIDINLRPDRASREVKTQFCRKGVARDYERFLSKRKIEALKVLMS